MAKVETTKEKLDEYLGAIEKIRQETSAWAALKSKRFTVTMAMVLVLGWIAIQVLAESAILALPIFFCMSWVTVAYMKGQAQVDAEQQKALGRIGGGESTQSDPE